MKDRGELRTLSLDSTRVTGSAWVEDLAQAVLTTVGNHDLGGGVFTTACDPPMIMANHLAGNQRFTEHIHAVAIALNEPPHRV